MNGKKLLLQKLMLLLLLLVVVAAGAAVSFGKKNKSAKDDGNAASKGTTASSASGTASGETTENQESALEKDKTETVYIKSDAEGNTKEITVETTLKHPSDGSDIRDQSNLKDIRNTRGDEEYTQGSDGSLIWENHGADISYKGTSDAEPPVRVKVTYYLNGEQISPKRLAGKSGRVTIRFDYENTATETVTVKKKAYEVQTPFLVMSALVLPSDTFSNIEVTNGKLMNMDDQSMVIGCAMPGLADSLQLSGYEVTEDIDIPEYVEVSADAKDFELEFTATVITPGLLEDLDTDDLKDADDFADGMDDLKDGVDDMDEGVGELYDGLKDFNEYLDEFTDGVTALRDAMNQVKDGAGKLNENSKALNDGAAALQSGLEQLNAALGAAGGTTGNSGENGASESEAAGNEAAAAGQAAFAKTVSALGAAAEADPESEEGKAQQEALAALGLTAEDAQNLAAYAKTLSEAGTSAGELRSQLAASAAALAEGSRQLTTGLTAYTAGVSALYEGTTKVVEGGTTLCTAGGELYRGFGEALDGVKELRDGVRDFKDDGIAELTKLGGSDFRNVMNRLRAVKGADDGYDNFAGLAEGKTGSVRFIVETEEIKK